MGSALGSDLIMYCWLNGDEMVALARFMASFSAQWVGLLGWMDGRYI